MCASAWERTANDAIIPPHPTPPNPPTPLVYDVVFSVMSKTDNSGGLLRCPAPKTKSFFFLFLLQFLFFSASVLFFFCFLSAFGKLLLLKRSSQPGPAPAPPSASQPPRPAAPAFYMYCTRTFYCFAIGAAMGNILNPKQHCFAIGTVVGSILNPKQYCFAISNITIHKVLTSWMHEASHWKCQCRILTARTPGHGKKICRPWSQLAGNMTGHLALIRGNENHIGGYNLIFVLFFLVWIVVTVSVTRQAPG